jgi:DNA-binding NtrC family response regulator
MSSRRHTVMVVDDEPEIVGSVRRTLHAEPYRVIGTTSPLEALEAIEVGGIDLLIADIDMPELDGIELVSRVRAVRPDVVRILLTADVSLRSAIEAINRGEVYRFITKPWKAEELCQTVREGLARQDELRRVAAADHATRTREAYLAALEQEFLGIRTVDLEDGVYVLDLGRLRRVVAELGSPELAELLAHGTAPPESFDVTMLDELPRSQGSG